jgi:putative CRISPR-associated protein (TIGR02620 family)
MTTWFVTRHSGAVEWAREEGLLTKDADVRVVDALEPARDVSQGDTIIGTLPVQFVADIGERGARYFHLTMSIPPASRGQELTAAQMREFGISVQGFTAFGTESRVEVSSSSGGKSFHICLVSDQYMANLLPILKRRPTGVVLVCTPEMLKPKKGRDRLENALSHYGYAEDQLVVYRLSAQSSTDLAQARNDARALRKKLLKAYPTWSMVLNATGGTKALSTAFFLEFQGNETIYTDTANGGFIRQLSNAAHPPEPLGQLVPAIEDFLHCQGYDLLAQSGPKWKKQAQRWQAVSSHLAAQMATKSPILSILNDWRASVEKLAFGGKKYFGTDKGRNKEYIRAIGLLPSSQLGKYPQITEVLVDHGLLTVASENSFLFASVEAMDYLGGGWLEQWAWLQAAECNPHGLAANVQVRAQADVGGDDYAGFDPDNELDLVILHNNSLLIAECKTIRWGGANAKQEIFNKLDALTTHTRGLFGKSLLVSAYPLDDKARRRARAYGLQVVVLTNPTAFQDTVRQWMGLPPARPPVVQPQPLVASSLPTLAEQ